MMKKQTKEDEANLIAMAMQPDLNYGSMVAEEKVTAPDRNVFSDGVTRIDFVLAWEEDLTELKDENSEEKVAPAAEDAPDDSHRKWREHFLSGLQATGILLEKMVVENKTKQITYVLISAPWSVLCYYAEDISLRVPLQVVPLKTCHWSEKILRKLSIPNLMAQDVPKQPPDFYACQFRTNKLDRYLGSDNKDTFFKNTQRHAIVYEILARTPYGVVERGEVGIDRLVKENVFSAAYPLHEGPLEIPDEDADPQTLSVRQILNHYWAPWGRWKKYQPLDHIRLYFGEKIALYFAWLGFYIGWLLPASVVGIVVFLFGIWLMVTDVPAKELCSSGGTYVMCPLCNACNYWNLSSICMTFKAGLLFDHGGTVFFSIFISLWAVAFLEYWKRTNAVLAHRWDCTNFEETEERPRPEFCALAPMTMRNPVTGAEEPYFPESSRLRRTITGCMAIIIMIIVVLIFLVGVIIYRSIMHILIARSKNAFFIFSAGKIASITGSMLNLMVIMILSRVYVSLARVLTHWEMHRTQTKYEDAFILKVFIFQFVNFYSTPIYIGFFRGRFVGFPGNHRTIFGIIPEDCDAGGCLIELAQELVVIMVGKQLINNVEEFVCPKLKSWWKKRQFRQSEESDNELEGGDEGQGKSTPPWETDYTLLRCEGLFSEYLDMVIQFGFVTIFVAAIPLAPLFALLNNWIELRLDAQKFVREYRRPVAERAQDIGLWLNIMQVMASLAVISNAFLIAFTSDFLPRLYYRYTTERSLNGYVNFTLSIAPDSFAKNHTQCRFRGHRDHNGSLTPEFFQILAIQLVFIIIFEHVVFSIGNFINMIIPDIPEEVQITVKTEHYMAKEALAERNQTLGRTGLLEEKEKEGSELRRRHKPEASTSLPRDTDSPPPVLTSVHEEQD
ncbi:hypothetical protein COCON_G00190250 [Conger conger]|uniref:Anoctamin n=1 Tax=Conger conger TaxID=82655 RepID=A0A9Q1D459_CONCO|nr:hypothetical protein COCON_G00190250 [Conger conger]